MTNEIQVLPVTAQQATEAKIANSVKISKQLMKSELKKRMKALDEQRSTARADANALHDYFSVMLNNEVKRQVNMELQNDGQITRFRNLYTKFSRFNSDDKDFPKFESNLEMLQSFNMSDITCNLFRSSVYDKNEDYVSFLLGNASLTVNLRIPDRSHENDNYFGDLDTHNPLGYIQHVGISQGVRDIYHSCKELNAITEKADEKYHDVLEKLEGIDEVAEEMEATLLVNELKQSDEGMSALRIASDLVEGMLGDKPELLNLHDKEL